MTSRTEWENAIDDLGRMEGMELEQFDHETDETGSRCYAVFSVGKRDLLTFFAFDNGSVALETNWCSPTSGFYHTGPVFTLDEPVDTATGWAALLSRYHKTMEL